MLAAFDEAVDFTDKSNIKSLVEYIIEWQRKCLLAKIIYLWS
jgi:hypothetical protein